MSPELIAFIANFTLNKINEYRHRNDVLTVEEITSDLEVSYNEAIKMNDRLLKLTE